MTDTICAISTPPGIGGIAVARVSGPQAIDIVQSLWQGRSLADAATHTAHYGTVADTDGATLDEAVATVFRAPRSYTGEDVVEISVHGSRYVQQQLIHTLIARGARMAEPGEFTRRAFAAGNLDLAQAEAVADIIASENRAAHRLAVNQMRGGISGRLKTLRESLIDLSSLLELELDFPDEDVEFADRTRLLHIAREVSDEVNRLAGSFSTASAIRQGIPVAIVGATNAGKSSLLNALLGDDRAIVSDIHGTTRDIVEDRLNIGDYTFRIMDTAGLRDTSDTIERLGIQRSERAARTADIIIAVVDGANPVVPDIPDNDATLIVTINKTDLQQSPQLDAALAALGVEDAWHISARNGTGIDALRQRLCSIVQQRQADMPDVMVTNARHYQALTRASESVARVIDGLSGCLSGDLVALDIRDTIHHLSEILGDISSTDILHTIFSRFCIGK